MPSTGRNLEWVVPMGWNVEGSRGENDIVAVAGSGGEGRTDKVGSESNVLL